jgi:potassium large conductance calcium-activated channel subfamily M alpha protein 1
MSSNASSNVDNDNDSFNSNSLQLTPVPNTDSPKRFAKRQTLLLDVNEKGNNKSLMTSNAYLPEMLSAMLQHGESDIVTDGKNDKMIDRKDEIFDSHIKLEMRLEQARIKMVRYITTSTSGQLYTKLLLTLSLLSPLQFIYQTYLTPDQPDYLFLTEIFNIIEMILASIFSMDWVLNFFLADHKLAFISSFFSMIDLMTVVPVWVTVNNTCIAYEDIHSSKEAILYILCGMGTTRIMRALRLKKYLNTIHSDIDRLLGEITLVIVTLILFNAALMQYLEQSTLGYQFHTYVYCIWVTISTVGYGDISPKSEYGRLFTMAMIAFAIIVVPKMSNELIEKLNEESPYARSQYLPITKSSMHILCCGDMSSSSLDEFFSELFHEDHDNANLHCVVLQSGLFILNFIKLYYIKLHFKYFKIEYPSPDMKKMIHDPKRILQITYLEGSALSEDDLIRCKTGTAVAIFIMTNKFSANPDEEDAKTILQQFSIKKFLAQDEWKANAAVFCMQLVRPENRRHLVGNTSNEDVQSDLVVCMNEIKMGVIAKASMYPGANTFIMNLLSSFAEDEEDELEIENNQIQEVDDEDGGSWISEYQRGCSWEIYTTSLSKTFIGKTFAEVSNTLYLAHGIILFGLQIEDIFRDKSNTRMLLNPADYIIPSEENLKIDAFVMAMNKKQGDLAKGSDEDDEGFLSNIMGNLGFNNSSNEVMQNEVTSDFFKDEPEIGYVKKETVKKGFAWQQLRSKFQNVGSKKLFSHQEEVQRIKDLHMQDNYYIRDHPAELSNCYIRSSLIEEIPNADNIIIIIGKSLSNLFDLIRPMRAKYLGYMNYIVILYPGIMPHSVWQKICIFESILIVRGSSLEEADIRRAGVFKANQIIVLADESSSKADVNLKDISKMEALIDSDAIFCYQCVKRMNENANVVIEIVRHNNVCYLDPESTSSSGDYKFTPQFASGSLFTSSLLDTIVCQSFYNPQIIDVIAKLVSGGDDMDVNEMEDRYGSDKTKKISGIAAIRGSCFYQIPIPADLPSKTFGSLVTYLSARNIVVLGLYRGVFAHISLGPKGNKMPYVFTNPPKDSEIFSCDKAFVLSQRPLRSFQNLLPGQSSKVIDLADKERTHVLQMKQKRKKTSAQYLAETSEIISDLQKQMLETKNDTAQIEESITRFNGEMTSKLTQIFSFVENLKLTARKENLEDLEKEKYGRSWKRPGDMTAHEKRVNKITQVIGR